ncbi:MAG: acetyl-CoA carboxylase, carboxyltransferase subunit beta [Planctomycetota bacterium]|nr:acetyl-CoA carboxylase, carboxyltransferase subunit beta [Planctomycetota bacterium]|tara:strand:- start:7321 stop:8172 length:852 start_codon:yes stop_codon:yes gene_type:complete
MAEVKSRSWSDVEAGHPTGKKPVPEGLWVRCPSCSSSLFRRSLENNLNVCPECEHHFRLSGIQRVEQLSDPGTFVPMDADLVSADPLEFVDVKAYPDRIAAARKKTGQNDAVQCGTAFIKGRKVIMAVMDFTFLGGSMGSVVGEKIARATEAAAEENLPLIVVSASGGARMMESGLSLMQMAKTSAALARFDEMGGLFISVLTDPTTGGVTASFAMLGDVILAEPKALIGFAGPRVIEQTIRQELPEGFQRSEFLLECGFVDRVVHRSDLRSEISSLIDYAGK